MVNKVDEKFASNIVGKQRASDLLSVAATVYWRRNTMDLILSFSMQIRNEFTPVHLHIWLIRTNIDWPAQ